MHVELETGFRRQDSLGYDRQNCAQQSHAKTDAESASNQRKKKTLHEELSEDAGATGAHGSAYCDFPEASRSLRQQKVRNVHACDQQDKSNSSEQQPQIADALLGQEIILQGLDRSSPSLVA